MKVSSFSGGIDLGSFVNLLQESSLHSTMTCPTGVISFAFYISKKSSYRGQNTLSQRTSTLSHSAVKCCSTDVVMLFVTTPLCSFCTVKPEVCVINRKFTSDVGTQ